MRHGEPALSVRQDAASTMAGAIFMCNTLTREQGFQASIFGLPVEYESFVSNIRKGMPLFLFDYTLRKLYGVFEAASDGGLGINNAAFRSVQRSYPAQVRINIVWKCRPLSEDEFSPAIEENYYETKKFYFDLSYEQVVRLYELFDDRRVDRPIHDYSKTQSLETKHSSKGTLDQGGLTPDVPHPSSQSHLLVPNISEVVRRYSTPASMHTDIPSVEAHPNMLMPFRTESFGAKIAPTHSRHDQVELHSQSDCFPAASVTDAVSTQMSAPCSQTSRHYQLVAKQSYPLPHNYPHNNLSSGCTTQEPIEGAKYVANQSYPLSHGYLHNGLLTSGYAAQNPTYNGRDNLNSSFTPYGRSYPHLSPSNPQSNSDYQVHCDICFNQGRSGDLNEIYACDRQCFTKGESLASAKLSRQGISAYPVVTAHEGITVSAINKQNRSSTDYIQNPDCDEDFKNNQMEHGIRSNTLDSSDLENDIVDPGRTEHAIGDDINRKFQCSSPQRSAFSRLSIGKPLTSQGATGPTLDQLVSNLSQKTEQWSIQNRPIHLIEEQAMDCSHGELSLPSQLELQEESMQPHAPFLNFKRRSEAGKTDTNLGQGIGGKVKRRKLVRPSFGENNASTNIKKDIKENCTQDRKQNHLEVSETHFDIDLNIPAASADSDPVENDRIAECPTVVIKIQTGKSCDVSANKTNCSDVEAIKEQDSSFGTGGAPAQKVSIDFNIAELNTMDESKLRSILDQTSSLLQALGKLKSGKSNNSEEARSGISDEDRKVNSLVNSDGCTRTEYN